MRSNSSLNRPSASCSADGTPQDRGAILLEFALVSLILYLLFAATIGFGRVVQASQVAQDTARLAAREFALTPLPAASTFEDALTDPMVLSRIFDPEALVIDLDVVDANGVTLDSVFASLPLINRSLRPAMIFDRPVVDGVQRRLVRAPGALLRSTSDPSRFTVGVPLVVSRDDDGVETIRWLSVVEEVRVDPTDPTTGSFSLASANPDRGVVGIRINLPVQASALTSFQPTPLGGEPNAGRPNLADDSAVIQLDGPRDGTLLPNIEPGPLPDGTPSVSPYGGPFGLGSQFALATETRPYRRVVTGQAFFRREVFRDL
ncbi:MAG: TadE family protein [Planctomycetota bacterium]